MGWSLSRYWQDVELGVKNLLLHKLRSFLTMLGLVFGVGSVIAMLAVQEGASEEALRQIRLLGSRNIIISAQKPPSEAGDSTVRSWMSVYGLLYDEEDLIRATMPQVTALVPVKEIRKEGRYGGRALDLRVVGTSEKWLELVRRPMLAGRFLSAHDVYQTSAAVVLSVTGGLVGIGVGKLIPWIISQAVGMPTRVTTASMLLSLGISVSVGLVFGIYPALRAARLDPIEALRHE